MEDSSALMSLVVVNLRKLRLRTGCRRVWKEDSFWSICNQVKVRNDVLSGLKN
jgi:hypothetical protein